MPRRKQSRRRPNPKPVRTPNRRRAPVVEVAVEPAAIVTATLRPDGAVEAHATARFKLGWARIVALVIAIGAAFACCSHGDERRFPEARAPTQE